MSSTCLYHAGRSPLLASPFQLVTRRWCDFLLQVHPPFPHLFSNTLAFTSRVTPELCLISFLPVCPVSNSCLSTKLIFLVCLPMGPCRFSSSIVPRCLEDSVPVPGQGTQASSVGPLLWSSGASLASTPLQIPFALFAPCAPLFIPCRHGGARPHLPIGIASTVPAWTTSTHLSLLKCHLYLEPILTPGSVKFSWPPLCPCIFSHILP